LLRSLLECRPTAVCVETDRREDELSFERAGFNL